jgi:hypothetical protein
VTTDLAPLRRGFFTRAELSCYAFASEGRRHDVAGSICAALREALKPATVLFEGDDPRFFRT